MKVVPPKLFFKNTVSIYDIYGSTGTSTSLKGLLCLKNFVVLQGVFYRLRNERNNMGVEGIEEALKHKLCKVNWKNHFPASPTNPKL